MKKGNTTKYILLTFVVAFLCSPVFANIDVITAADLSKKLRAKEKVTIVSVRKIADYKKAHMRNAIHIDLKALCNPGKPEGILKSPAEVAKLLGAAGISNMANIVVYDDGKMKSAGRMYWILKYLGAENVSVLHRDLPAWKAARIMVTKAPTPTKKTTFAPKINKAMCVDKAAVKGRNGALLVDVRKPEEFKGTSTKPVSKGHIPGAVNLPHENLLQVNGALKAKPEIEKAAKAAGLSPDKEAIIYCASATRAGLVYMILDGLGYNKIKVYEGGYNEWEVGNKLEK